MKPTKIVVFCGSSKFCDVMAVCAWLVEKHESAITMGLHLLPYWYCTEAESHLAEAEGIADQMDELHLRKIDLATEVFVVNINDYIGESTAREIRYAEKKGIKLRWYMTDPIGDEANQMLLDFIEKEANAPTPTRPKPPE